MVSETTVNTKKSFDVSTIRALDFDNLNDQVLALVTKVKEDTNEESARKKRRRKNGIQVKVLKNEYTKNPDWSRDVIKKLSEELGLSECQIYKWRWDHLKKSGTEMEETTVEQK
jgi:hypothetical protein